MPSQKKYTKIQDLVAAAKARKALPAIVKRCVASIHDKAKAGKFKPRKGYTLFDAALEVCIASFQKAGILKGDALALTSKGNKRNKLSKSKKDTPDRFGVYDKLSGADSATTPAVKKKKKRKLKKKKRFQYLDKK